MIRPFCVLALTLAFSTACAKDEASQPREPHDPAPVTSTAGTTQPAVTAADAPAVRGPRLLPVDEASNDPGFAKFREDLLAAARDGNIEAIVAMSDPGIRTTFGGGGGAADLRRMLGEPGMLADLEQLLTLGGSFRGEGARQSFWAPYVYSSWPDEHDPYESLAVIGESVPLLPGPDASAKPLATLSYDIVTRAKTPDAPSKDFIEVQTADGKRGWVPSRSLRSHIGYRAGFSKSGDKWRMDALVAGD
jgi:hypothetical protein